MNSDASEWDCSYDLVIVGSGAASVCASLVALAAGRKPIIVEKADYAGGSTGISGGVLWVPNNPLAKRAGVDDSYEKSRAYLDACVGAYSLGSTPERRHAFLTQGPEMVSFLEREGIKFIHLEGWSDYHENEMPHGMARGRSLSVEVFDMRRLGAFAKRMRRPEGRPPLRGTEPSEVMLFGRTWRSRFAMLRVGWRMLLNRLGRDLVAMGEALQGRLFEQANKRGVPIWTKARVEEIIVRDGRAVGVQVNHDGKRVRIAATDGILVNAGGFSHNLAMRQAYQQAPITTDWTVSNPGDTGEIIAHLKDLGADLAQMDMSWWLPVSIMPDGTPMIAMAEVSKPHCIMVDASGSRFVSESTSYGPIGIAMYDRNKTARSVPSWAILDRRHRERYIWAGAYPGAMPKAWLDSGHFKQADSIADLARQCGIDPDGLEATVRRFNDFAEKGADDDFGRGRSAFHHFLGDPSNKPNPNLGKIEQGPFYAVEIFPGDVGTCGGVVTDEHARVLRPDGSVIAGLYAAGNSTASVMGYSYPAAGASIGPAMIFGYIAALHATRQPDI